MGQEETPPIPDETTQRLIQKLAQAKPPKNLSEEAAYVGKLLHDIARENAKGALNHIREGSEPSIRVTSPG
jgi:hypothetical protein